MLHEFLSANREEIIARASAKVAKPTAPRATPFSLENGISLFLTQLVGMLASPPPRRAGTGGDRRERDQIR